MVVLLGRWNWWPSPLLAAANVLRQLAAADRRSIELTIAPRGSALYEATRRTTQAHLAALLQPLSAEDLATLEHALETLRQTFALLDARSPKIGDRSAEAGDQSAETTRVAPSASASPTTAR